MPRKIDLITELYKRTIKDITSDSVAWRAFLHSAGFQYKYPFADQVLIYAQRPMATACAETHLWNTHFGRWVNRGATGIALIEGRSAKNYLNYVFDVSDTHHRENKPFEIWSVKPEYEADVIEALQNRFIDDDKPRDKLSDAVIAAAINLGADNITDYLHELSYEKEGSFLEELDEDNLRVRFLLTVQASVAYSVLTRLGYTADEYVGKEMFEWVHEFNTPATVNILGTATSDISEMCLREIERTVKSVERSIQRENRTFDDRTEIGYNDGGKAEIENRNGGTNNVNHLQDRERRADSELGAARTDEPHNREVRSDEIEFHEGTPQRNLHDDSDRGQAEQLSSRDRRDSESTDRDEYIPDGTEPWGIGEDENREPDVVGTDDEQLEEHDGGGSADVSNLRISDSTLPQISDPESLIQILRHGDFLRQSKENIVSFLTSNASEAEKVEYVKKAYPPLVFTEFYKQGTDQHIGYRADDESLLLYVGNFPSRTSEMRMDWAFVTRLIQALITDKNYLDKPVVKEDHQMSLFDTDMPEVKTVANDEPIKVSEPSKQMLISQEVIDEFLRLGGCTRKSVQRIYSFYRKANDQAENIDFLKKEYETDSVGIVVNDRQYAAMWDKNGIRISTGDRVKDYSSITLPWETVDKRIRELLEMGQYIPAHEAEQAGEAWDAYIEWCVDMLYNDHFFYIPEEYKIQPKEFMTRDNEKQFYLSIIKDPAQAGKFVQEVRDNIKRLEKYPSGRSMYFTAEYCASIIERELREPIDYPLADPNLLPPKQFVSQDMIDAVIRGSDGDADSKRLRIYSFFCQNKDANERAKMLKDLYGWASSYNDRGETEASGKGLAICGGLMKNSDQKILLKWSQVAKRIDELIRQDKYLGETEKTLLDSYEARIIAREIIYFYSSKKLDVIRPFDGNTIGDFWEVVDQLEKQVADKSRLSEIIEMMQGTFETMSPEDHKYEENKKELENVKAYAEGTFNLFPGSPYRKKTPFAPEKQEEVKKPTVVVVKEPTEEEIPESEYKLHLGTTVNIGKDECDILSLSKDKVELFNGTLIPLELDYETFMRRVRDNPLNNHLRKDSTEQAVEMPKPNFKTETKPKQSRKRKTNEPTIESITADLEAEYARWDELLTNGGSDPTWSDGVNMNLVQGRIVARRRELLQMCGEGEKPAILNREEPPRMSNDYMARADEIREAAKKSLEIYKTNPTYLWCKAQFERIPQKMLKNSVIPNIMGYVSGLEKYIEKDDLVSMRRHRNPNGYLESFDRCKEEIEKLLPQIEREQMTDDIFAALMNEDKPVEPKEENVTRVGVPNGDIWGKYEQMKQQFPDHIVMVRVGDFFEFFEDDAVNVADALELTLTGRAVAGKPTRVPMCGIPYHKESDYVKKLIDKGFKVAIDGGEELIQKGNEQPVNEEKKYSPLGRRYLEAQKEYPDHLVMMLVLDSYEFYGEDAKVLSEVAGLELTSRDIMGIGEVPMCKFRVHQTDNYLQKLLDAGHSVVICDSTSMKPIKATTVKEQTHTDAEIARILPDKGSDILRLYENLFSDDRFYVDTEKGEVRWVYFNPDSTSKGQFIENIVTFEQIVEHKYDMDYSVFFDKLGSEAKQYIVDSDDKEFKDAAYHYLTDEYTFRGFGSAAREILISTAEEKEMADMRESPNRFSIRRVPHEAGRVGLWDASIKKYLGENGQLYLFADQRDAIRHLAYLQHEHGIPEAVIFTTEKGKAYHVGDTLFTSFENNDGGVHIEIANVDEYYVWYTMPTEPGQKAVNMDRGIFEKYLDTGNITVLFSEQFVPDRTPEEIEADKAEVAELTAVSRFLHATKMDDIDIYFDVGEIVAKDSNNEWRGKEFYEFLLNDAIALDENLDPVEGISINDEILNPVIELAEKYGANIVRVPSREVDELERAKDFIREYLVREFDEQEDHFDDLNKIELAYTTVSDADIPIQANINLVDFKLEKYFGDVLVETVQFNSLKEMNDNLLCGLDFGGLTEVTDDQIEQYWQESKKEIPQLAEEPKPRKTFPVYNSHPEIPDSEKHNYRITDNEIGMGGAKAKFRKNIDAIKLLYQLEAEDRLATPEEQEVLAQYSGWGGLADAFDSTKDNWHLEYNELLNLLSSEEYEAANESTLTAFYTPPVVIKAMYDALENMGFKRGNILEPSCGVGNFMGLLPENMDAKMYGVELDSISGRIARQLYQKNGITIDGYEKTHFPDSFFDVAIGNVPFNDFKLLDKKYDKYNFLIHDYFFGATRS